MRKVNYYFLYLIAGSLFGCSTSTSMTSSQNAYREDLSVHRMQYENIEEEAAAVDRIKEVPISVSGTIEPHTDITDELNSSLEAISEDNKRKIISGYTILVYSGPSRDEANKSKDMVYRVLPDSRPQIQYVQPYYRVKVGRYVERIEAQKQFTTLKKEFPSAMLVPERFTLN